MVTEEDNAIRNWGMMKLFSVLVFSVGELCHLKTLQREVNPLQTSPRFPVLERCSVLASLSNAHVPSSELACRWNRRRSGRSCKTEREMLLFSFYESPSGGNDALHFTTHLTEGSHRCSRRVVMGLFLWNTASLCILPQWPLGGLIFPSLHSQIPVEPGGDPILN